MVKKKKTIRRGKDKELKEKIAQNKEKYISIAQKILLVIFGIYIIIFQCRHTLWLDELDLGI